MSKEIQKVDPWKGTKDFIAGSIAGVAQVTIPYPFDTVKTKLQTQSGQFRGVFDCFRQTIRNEGVTGLYKGMMSPVAGVAFQNALTFYFYGKGETYVKKPDQKYLTLPQVWICGALAGLGASIVTSPMELVKIKQQVASSNPQGPQYKGSIDCAKQILQTQGLRALYRGWLITIVREIPGNGSWYFTFEFMRRSFAGGDPKNVPNLPTYALIVSGACAGIGYVTSSYPIDVVKSLVQMRNEPISAFTVARNLFASKGIRGFWAGYSSGILRAIPAASSTFVTFEIVRRFLN